MSTLLNTDPAEAIRGRILIVDDDPLAAGMLGVSLAAAGHDTIEANSGEEALAKLADPGIGPQLDLIILDIEMNDGIDGYETCRRLRATGQTRDLPVIFLSGHDELDDRLRAYDAGGSDFMAKPFVPDEVLRKVMLSIRHKRKQDQTAAEQHTSFDTAMAAMSSLGESGVTLNFSRGALGCRTLRALATLTIESMGAFGVNSQVQFRTPSSTQTFTIHGPASPLEESVFEKSRDMGRLFSFHNRLIVNYDCVSLLVPNMPIADDSLCGRIRDHASMIAEAAELAVDNINLRSEIIQRSEDARLLADASYKAVDELRIGFRELQLVTHNELEDMTNRIENLYVHLGLTERQENTISSTVRETVERILKFLERGNVLEQNFAEIAESLRKAGEYIATGEDEPPPSIDLW